MTISIHGSLKRSKHSGGSHVPCKKIDQPFKIYVLINFPFLVHQETLYTALFKHSFLA